MVPSAVWASRQLVESLYPSEEHGVSTKSSPPLSGRPSGNRPSPPRRKPRPTSWPPPSPWPPRRTCCASPATASAARTPPASARPRSASATLSCAPPPRPTSSASLKKKRLRGVRRKLPALRPRRRLPPRPRAHRRQRPGADPLPEGLLLLPRLRRGAVPLRRAGGRDRAPPPCGRRAADCAGRRRLRVLPARRPPAARWPPCGGAN